MKRKWTAPILAALTLGLAACGGGSAPPAGTPDTSFGGGGKVTTAFATGYDEAAYAIALAPDGKIVLAGRSQTVWADFAIKPYTPQPP
jgi:hypothetical protein